MIEQGSWVLVLTGEWAGKPATVSRVAGDGRLLLHVNTGGMTKVRRYYDEADVSPISELPEKTRKCYRCHELLPLSSFPVKSRLPLGHGYICRSCKKRDNARTQKFLHEETRPGATHHHQEWTDEELSILMESGQTLLEIAKRVHRTYSACAQKRSELRGQWK